MRVFTGMDKKTNIQYPTRNIQLMKERQNTENSHRNDELIKKTF